MLPKKAQERNASTAWSLLNTTRAYPRIQKISVPSIGLVNRLVLQKGKLARKGRIQACGKGTQLTTDTFDDARLPQGALI